MRSFVAIAAAAALCMAGASVAAQAREIVVSQAGADTNAGDTAHPFLTIQRAAEAAQPGDVVTIRSGVYRERIDPPRGGLSESQRIVFRAAPGGDVRIVGSESVAGWLREGAVWRVRLPSGWLGAFNPFATSVRNPNPVRDGTEGNWGWLRYGRWAHLGDVYLNGEALTESETDAGLVTAMTWRASVDEEGATTIRANFGSQDPNRSWVEVNVRPLLFYPSRPGLNYITVEGLTFMNAAPHWAPPTVEQVAAVGPNGGHHWIIENNTILYARNTCISLGIPSGAADQSASGHHIVRNNVIMRCGQAGIVGQGWNSHSLIAGNSIEDINYRHEFGGAETGGIKLHNSRDTVIENNFVRNVGTIDALNSNGDGIWLDNQNAGVTVRNNVVIGAEGSAILMEANWQGANFIEGNVVIGGRVATYSSRDTQWRRNLFVDAPGYWVNQDFGNRPTIEGASWENNIFIGSGMTDSIDLTRHNLYLGAAEPRDGEAGAIRIAADPQFALDLSSTEATISFVIDAVRYRALPRDSADITDFHGNRRLGGFAFGPFADLESGENEVRIFRFNPRRAQARAIVECRRNCALR